MADDFTDLIVEYDEVGGSDDGAPASEPEQIDDEILREVVSQLRADIDDADDLFESEFEADRERSQKYYNGGTDLPSAGDNRSKYVHTKVRDTIRMLKPDIMRVLCGSPQPVVYLPNTPEQAALAEQQTEYVTQLFHRLGGYRLIYDAAHTSCLHKLGVAKVSSQERKTPKYASYTGIDEMQLQMLQSNPDLTVIIDDEQTVEIPPDPMQPPQVGPDGQPMPPQPQVVTTYDVDVVQFETKVVTCMEALPPEDFLIDEWADSAEKFRLIGHRRNVTISEAIEMGFDEAQVIDLDGEDPETHDHVGLSEQRRGYQLRSDDTSSSDRSQDKFLLTEVYYHADLDELGVSQLYRFWLGGTSHKYLDHERVDDHPFALFAIDPEPFTIYGKSVYDITHLDQDVMTSLTRATIDNAHISNNPRLSVHETLVNMEDVLNNDIGAPIRNRGAGNVQVIDVPFTGGQLLPLMNYLDEAIDNKIGITRASVGLDPNALQSTDKQAVQNTIAKQAGQVELAVRNLAETGMKRLFRLLLKETLNNPNPVAVMKVHGTYVPAPLGSFNPGFDMDVAVGIGTANTDQRLMALEKVAMQQEKVVGMLGPGNPIVSLAQMMNTVEDGIRLMGMHNINRYFNRVTPQVEQQIAQQAQAAQQQPQQPDPTQAIIEGEKIKAQSQMQIAQGKGQIDMQKAQAKHQHDMSKLTAEQQFQRSDAMRKDDLSRDQMIQDLYLQLAQIQAQLGGQVETARINADVQREQAQNSQGGI